MTYRTYGPHADLAAIVKFYWTLEVPYDPANEKQVIVPDGCVEMTFNFADPIRRFTTEGAYVLQPDAMVMGQRTRPFHILPLGHVDTFAVCFYPIGFGNIVKTPLDRLTDTELPLRELFPVDESEALARGMSGAADVSEHIRLIEAFLRRRLDEAATLSRIVTETVDALLQTRGTTPIYAILKEDGSKRRQLERQFRKQIGISPKRLGRAIRLQTALNLLLNRSTETLTEIAYEADYFDQTHFIKDFKELVGVTPTEFYGSAQMSLSALFYKSG